MIKKAELVFVPAPGVGHLVSTLEFAKRLIDRDDRILITVLVMKLPFSSFVFVNAYIKSSITASQSGSAIRLIDLPEVEPHPPEILNESVECYFTLFIESHSSEFVRVTGLVVDFFCVSMVDVASELCLPCYIFFPSNAGFLSLMLYLPTTCHDQMINTVFESSDSELIIPGFVNPVPVSVLPPALFNKYGYSSFIKLAQRFNDLEPHAVDSFSSILKPSVYTVGPVLELKGQPNPDLDKDHCHKILKWLDDQSESSVVFLCFESGGSFGPARVKEIATGLEQSEYKFVWSLRVSQPSNKSPLVLDSNSTNGDDDVFTKGFMERVKGRGMICAWAPQVEVLAHKAIGGFVSHCGWNSVLESLWSSVLIVTWPLYAEQQLNAFRMAKELGLAVEMRLDSTTDGGDLVMADEIGRAIRCVMDGDSDIRKKVKQMAETSKKALLHGRSSFVSLG
ncbi:hypothetical protein ACOSQ4_027974 [Xanthoceras sorbifolium]